MYKNNEIEVTMNWPEATAAIAAGGGLLAVLYKFIDSKNDSKESGEGLKTIKISIESLDSRILGNEKDIIILKAKVTNLADEHSQFKDEHSQFKIEIQQAVENVQKYLRDDFKEFKTDIKADISGLSDKIDNLTTILLQNKS